VFNQVAHSVPLSFLIRLRQVHWFQFDICGLTLEVVVASFQLVQGIA
jgi:hypothetical protein